MKLFAVNSIGRKVDFSIFFRASARLPTCFLICLLSIGMLPADGLAACRTGYSEGSLEKAKQAVLVGRISEIRNGSLEYQLALEYQPKSSTLGFSLFLTLSGTVAELQKLVILEQAFKERTISAVCVRPDSTSYYRNMQLPGRLILEFGALPILYELDPEKPVSN
jgi:hypothetical protein